MCGICGVIGIESKETSEGILRRMIGAMIHRGPDDEGVLLAPPVAVGMRHSLEVRVPFLDSPLVEYLLSLPESTKRGDGSPKALLIAALRDVLPAEIVGQRKRTFTFPWEHWLRRALGNRVAAGLADWLPALESQLGGDFATKVWKDYLAGRTSWSRPWSLYVLNEWVKRNIQENTASLDCNASAAVAIS